MVEAHGAVILADGVGVGGWQGRKPQRTGATETTTERYTRILPLALNGRILAGHHLTVATLYPRTPVTQRLALYFLAQDGATRVLDADHPPMHATPLKSRSPRPSLVGWLVGRLPDSDIAFSPTRNPHYALVSKWHAMITVKPNRDTTEGGTTIYNWELTELINEGRGATNGTYLQIAGTKPYRLAPGVPYLITEGSVAQFGCQDARVKFSFDIDDTQGPAEDTDPNTCSVKDGGPTEVKEKEVTGRTLADVAALILTGPPEVNRWIWLSFWATVGLAAVWLREH